MLDLPIFIALMLVKHFIADFVLQTKYQYLNKGRFGHPGGILHAAIHSSATFLILQGFSDSVQLCTNLALVEFVIHYLIDFSKVNITKKFQLSPTNSDVFWMLTGLDQLLHQLTYIAMCWFIL